MYRGLITLSTTLFHTTNTAISTKERGMPNSSSVRATGGIMDSTKPTPGTKLNTSATTDQSTGRSVPSAIMTSQTPTAKITPVNNVMLTYCCTSLAMASKRWCHTDGISSLC